MPSASEKRKLPKLPIKQRLFVQEYLIDLNATQAAVRAGYSSKTAVVQGPRLLGKVRIQSAIKEYQELRQKASEVTIDKVLLGLFQIAMADIAEAYDEDGKLKNIHDIPEAVRRAVAGVETFEEYEGRGENRKPIGQTKKIRCWDKLKAFELLGRHLGMFGQEVDIKMAFSLFQIKIVELVKGLPPEFAQQIIIALEVAQSGRPGGAEDQGSPAVLSAPGGPGQGGV